jgi:hypothetical protein
LNVGVCKLVEKKLIIRQRATSVVPYMPQINGSFTSWGKALYCDLLFQQVLGSSNVLFSIYMHIHRVCIPVACRAYSKTSIDFMLAQRHRNCAGWSE